MRNSKSTIYAILVCLAIFIMVRQKRATGNIYANEEKIETKKFPDAIIIGASKCGKSKNDSQKSHIYHNYT